MTAAGRGRAEGERRAQVAGPGGEAPAGGRRETEVWEEAGGLGGHPWRLRLARAVLALACLLVWQAASGTLVDKFWVSAPADIAAKLLEWTARGDVFWHLGITLQEALYGFLLGASTAAAFGFLMGRLPTCAKILEPFVQAVYSLPRLALVPLFILWFGIGLAMKVVLAAIVVFFMVFWNTYAGVKEVDSDLLDVVMIMGANRRQILFKVIVPSALTWIFVGLRLSLPYALAAAVVGEIVASNRGLGYLIMASAGSFDTPGVFAALFVLMLVAMGLNSLLDWGENYILRWKRVSR